jgi:mRNA-degrading endonuclease RelE of RelBE toxin-antitoxin system
MKVDFLNSFISDLKKVTDKTLYQKVKNIIIEIENAEKISDILIIKKIKGSKTAFRIKIGDYRLGFYYENNVLELARFMHRKDIYRKFP